jgi:phosphoribosyl 1,2-cyclic phosphate phosphodiesterase
LTTDKSTGPMRVTFLGTGTSTGVPVIGCDCHVCKSDDPKNRRGRVAAMLSWDDNNVIIDTGPDFREQMLRHDVKHVEAVLYTHSHVDHLYGLDDLRMFCFRRGGPIPVYADPFTLSRIRHVFDYTFAAKVEGGGTAKLDPIELDGPFELFGRTVVPMVVMHGSLPVTAFRVGKFAYCTDCNHVPDETMAALEGVEVLVLDALRDKPHSTHFSIDEAVAVAENIGARQTYFVHMTHDVEHETVNAELPEGVALAYDGLQIEV